MLPSPPSSSISSHFQQFVHWKLQNITSCAGTDEACSDVETDEACFNVGTYPASSCSSVISKYNHDHMIIKI